MPTEYPEHTPWGRVDLATRHGDGLWFLSTSSHGGFWLSPKRRSELPDNIKGTSFVGQHDAGHFEDDAWWEEDCDAIKIARHFDIA